MQVCSPKRKQRRKSGVQVRTCAEKECVTVLDLWAKSLVGIAEDSVPRVHHVGDFHVRPQAIGRQHRFELHGQ